MADSFSLTTEVGRRVRMARKTARLSQSDLAERAGMSRPTIARIEGGRQSQVKPDAIRRIAAALARPESEFYPPEPGVPLLVSVIEQSDDLPQPLRRSLVELLALPDTDRQAIGAILDQLLQMRRALSLRQGQPSSALESEAC